MKTFRLKDDVLVAACGRYVHARGRNWTVYSDHPIDAIGTCDVLARVLPGSLGTYVLPLDATLQTADHPSVASVVSQEQSAVDDASDASGLPIIHTGRGADRRCDPPLSSTRRRSVPSSQSLAPPPEEDEEDEEDEGAVVTDGEASSDEEERVYDEGEEGCADEIDVDVDDDREGSEDGGDDAGGDGSADPTVHGDAGGGTVLDEV